MSKKAAKNGFYYLMLDFKERQEKKGIKYANLAEVQADPRCSEEWKNLSPEQKTMYNNKAKNGKKGTQEKRTGLGESVSLLEKQAMEAQQYETRMKESIEITIRQAIHTDRIDVISFYFIHVNWYYTKIDMNNVVDYEPAEFAVVEFSLREGVKRCYHEILTPEIKIGYTREAMEHSDETHRIDIYRQGPKNDYKNLYEKFHDFVSFGQRSTKKLPPLYTSRKLNTVVPCFLKKMADAAEVPLDTFDLYSFEYLFGTLMIELDANFPEFGNRSSLAEAELDKDAFIYSPNIECSYHSKFETGAAYCSQHIVTQWAYTLCDHFCQTLGVKMVNGVHCPENDEALVAGMQSLTVKEHRAKIICSQTGVSEAYRLKVSERTREENEQRKREGRPLTITYGDEEKEKSIIVPSAMASVSNSKGKNHSLRLPVSLSKILSGVEADLTPNDDNFPAIGSSKFKSFSKKK